VRRRTDRPSPTTTATAIGRPEPVEPPDEPIVEVDGGVTLGVPVAPRTAPLGLGEADGVGVAVGTGVGVGVDGGGGGVLKKQLLAGVHGMTGGVGVGVGVGVASVQGPIVLVIVGLN